MQVYSLGTAEVLELLPSSNPKRSHTPGGHSLTTLTRIGR